MLHPERWLTDLPHRCRTQWEHLPLRWKAWREGLRTDPSLLWHTPTIRIAALLILFIVGYVAVRWISHALVPGGPAAFQPPTPTATLYVACTNPDCRAQFTIQRPMSFKDWPVKCDRCGQRAVYRAQLCSVCRQWYAKPPSPAGTPPGGPTSATTAGCPHCAARRAPATTPAGPERKPGTDDEEDPW